MTRSGLVQLLSCILATVWPVARSPFLCHAVRRMSSQGEKSEHIKQSLKKLPEGHFDGPEDSNLEKVPLIKCPGYVNPVTKEKGGPRSPETA
ncbi:succinate dehydrogenase assembly factor 4, mitochondrial-like [Vulpes lagopus]|uniref:succinate dehydrogenase assembly factor 4, mitochondrial-like n=1 Tax=Vulpes lagopus TaxID=494514 RepID=UPI001BCA2EB3|nr:succinate dehydrogenase assembly factor 4, mitochondrial-like [Vulpes lagopus]